MTGYSPMTFNSLTTSPNICVYIREIGILKGSYSGWDFLELQFKKKKCP